MRALFFFFNDTATTEIYTLSLHDALPIFAGLVLSLIAAAPVAAEPTPVSLIHIDGVINPVTMRLVELDERHGRDRKSTRLNSSHGYISYAVFCLKKKKIPHSTPKHATDSI